MMTMEGIQRIVPVLAPATADLLDMYKIARKKCSNFSQLAEACNECDFPGHALDDEEATNIYSLLDYAEIGLYLLLKY
jgi:hypothetical protein